MRQSPVDEERREIPQGRLYYRKYTANVMFIKKTNRQQYTKRSIEDQKLSKTMFNQNCEK